MSDAVQPPQKPGRPRGGARPGAGRPRKFAGAIEAAVLRELVKGRPLNTAARLHGVWPSALRELMGKDPELCERVESARARGQARIQDLHAGLAKEGKRTAGLEWLLERLYPRDFGRAPIEVEHTGKDKGPVAHEVTLRIEDAIAGARGEPPAEVTQTPAEEEPQNG